MLHSEAFDSSIGPHAYAKMSGAVVQLGVVLLIEEKSSSQSGADSAVMDV
jgi:hypothetical protein